MVSVNTGYQFNPEDEEQKKGNFSILGGMINPNSAQTSELSNQGGQTSSAQPTQSSKPPPSGSSQGAPVAQQQYEANKGADQAVFAGSQVNKVKENISSQQKKANDAFEAFVGANTFSDRFEEGEVDKLASGDPKAVGEFQALKKAFSGDFENPANFSGAENDIKVLGKSPESFTNRALARGNRALDAALLRGSGAFGNLKSDLEKTLGSAKQQIGGLGEQAKTLQQNAETQRQAELAKADSAIKGRLESILAGGKTAAEDLKNAQNTTNKEYQSAEESRFRTGVQNKMTETKQAYDKAVQEVMASKAPQWQKDLAVADLAQQYQTQVSGLLNVLKNAKPSINFTGGFQGEQLFDAGQANQYNTLAGLLGLGDMLAPTVVGESSRQSSNVDNLLSKISAPQFVGLKDTYYTAPESPGLSSWLKNPSQGGSGKSLSEIATGGNRGTTGGSFVDKPNPLGEALAKLIGKAPVIENKPTGADVAKTIINPAPATKKIFGDPRKW